MLYSAQYASPFGDLTVFSSERGVAAVVFHKEGVEIDEIVTKEGVLNPQAYPNGEVVYDRSRFEAVFSEMDSYFEGTLCEFTVPIDYGDKGTVFQRGVWDALRAIPYGSVVTYGELAAQIGNSKAARAVGLANNRNPLAIFVPCHRVIGSNGRLVGYAGGLPFKRGLLELEGVQVDGDGSNSTRDAILVAGSRAFAGRGYSGTTVDEIAGAAGVNKRMIYHHFGSKRALYDEIVGSPLDFAAPNEVDLGTEGTDVALRLQLFQLLESASSDQIYDAATLERNARTVAALQAEGRLNPRYDTLFLARMLTLAERWLNNDDKQKPRNRVKPVVRRINQQR